MGVVHGWGARPGSRILHSKGGEEDWTEGVGVQRLNDVLNRMKVGRLSKVAQINMGANSGPFALLITQLYWVLNFHCPKNACWGLLFLKNWLLFHVWRITPHEVQYSCFVALISKKCDKHWHNIPIREMICHLELRAYPSMQQAGSLNPEPLHVCSSQLKGPSGFTV